MPDVQIAKIRVRQGTDAERKQIVLETGEPGFTVDTHRLVMGDGVTNGGIPAGTRSFVVSGAAPVPNGVLPGDYVFNASTSVIYILPTDFNPSLTPTWSDFLGITPGTVSVSGQYLGISGTLIYLTPNSIDSGALAPTLFQASNPVELNGGQIKLKYDAQHFTSNAGALTLNEVPGTLIANGTVSTQKLDPLTLSNSFILTGSVLDVKAVEPIVSTSVGLSLSADNTQLNVTSGALHIYSINGSEVNITNIPGGNIDIATLGPGLNVQAGVQLTLSSTGPIALSPTQGITLERSNEFSTSAGPLFINAINGSKISAGTLGAEAFTSGAVGDGLTATSTLAVLSNAPLISSPAGIQLMYDNTLHLTGGVLGVAPGAVSLTDFSGVPTSAIGNGLLVTSGVLAVSANDVLVSAPNGISLNYGDGLSSLSGALIVNAVNGSVIIDSSIAYNKLDPLIFGLGLSSLSGTVNVLTNDVITVGPAGVTLNYGPGLASVSGTLVTTPPFGISAMQVVQEDTELSAWQVAVGGMSVTSAYNLSGITLSAFNDITITVSESANSFSRGLTATNGISTVANVTWGAKLPLGVIHAQTMVTTDDTIDIILYNATSSDVTFGDIPYRVVCVVDGTMLLTANMP